MVFSCFGPFPLPILPNSCIDRKGRDIYEKWLIISASVAICAVLLFVGFINFKKYKLKRDVEEYLLMKGYKSSDIISITTHYGKLPSFGARVIFADG
ncbi:DUF3139 domain-containing protein [Mesorhizobium sp. M00.F.Ca.ET.186.01.1.1]|nr:DUF3139 domain-containing protein [Mesorhizobium sp. M00.F.Ca.ET.186.01.1.1]